MYKLAFVYFDLFFMDGGMQIIHKCIKKIYITLLSTCICINQFQVQYFYEETEKYNRIKKKHVTIHFLRIFFLHKQFSAY